MWLLSAVAVGLGLAGGGAAVGLFKLIGLITHLTLLHNVGFSLPTLRHYHPGPLLIVTAVAGGLAVSLFAAWAPVIRGHGIPESLEAILVRDSRIRPRAAVAKPLSAAITIGTGGPFGAEGPIIVTGGSIGSLVGQLLSTSPAERRIMLATGAAAGMAATFNAPVASVILAVELVLFERSLRTIVPLSIACSIAAGIHVVVFGSTPLFAIHQHLHVALGHLPLFAVVGLAAGALAVVLNKGLFTMEALFRRLPVKMFWWPAIGAVGFAVIGLFVPRSLSMGYSAISDTLNGHFAVAALGALFLAKLFSWWISLGSQTSGGTLAPMFLVGATMGALLGHGFAHAWPGLHVSPAAFALVAMGATFGAATKAPFTGAVFAFEVTGEYSMMVPLMIGVGVAELVAEFFLTDRLMTEKLSHRGFRVDFNAEVDPLRMKVVGQTMREPVALSADTTMAVARHFLDEARTSLVAVVDGAGRYMGVVRAADLGGEDGPSPDNGGEESIGRLVTTDLRPLSPGDFLLTALTSFIDRGIEVLPVVARDRVVGQLSRSDIAAERLRRHTSFEARQPGWAQAIAASLRRRRLGGAGLAAEPALLVAPGPDGALGGRGTEVMVAAASGGAGDVDGAGVDGAGVDGAGVDGAGVDGAGVDGAGVDGAGVDGAARAVPEPGGPRVH